MFLWTWIFNTSNCKNYIMNIHINQAYHEHNVNNWFIKGWRSNAQT